jgi:hypothetical protein
MLRTLGMITDALSQSVPPPTQVAKSHATEPLWVQTSEIHATKAQVLSQDGKSVSVSTIPIIVTTFPCQKPAVVSCVRMAKHAKRRGLVPCLSVGALWVFSVRCVVFSVQCYPKPLCFPSFAFDSRHICVV